MSTILQQRNKLVYTVVKAAVQEAIEAYFHGRTLTRRCLTCNRKFHPFHRYHFFDAAECRQEWYRGQIRPRRRP